MKRLRFERRIACPFSAAMEYAEDYFHQGATGSLRVPLCLGPLQVQFNRTIATGLIVCPDRTDATREHDALEVWMHPLGSPPFPELHALLTVRPLMPPGALIALELAYQPPFGAIGSLLDVIAGRHVAMAIGRALLDDLCAYLVTRSREFARIAAAPSDWGRLILMARKRPKRRKRPIGIGRLGAQRWLAVRFDKERSLTRTSAFAVVLNKSARPCKSRSQ